MNEKEKVESKVREAVEAAREVYMHAGHGEWRDCAEAWLSNDDRTRQTVRAASRIPGMDEQLTVFTKAIQKTLDLHVQGEDETSEAFEEARAEILGLAEEILPQPADPEAARPRVAAVSAFWATLSASFLAMGASGAALGRAETSLRLSGLLDED